jgi:predicted nucleic acid-binding protein
VDGQPDEDLYIASLTVAEIRRRILEKPAGKRRSELDSWFSGPEGPPVLFARRVLSFDERAGLVWARLMADGKTKGRSRSALDMIIAAVAEANDCVVVTDNEKDFAGIETLYMLDTNIISEQIINVLPFMCPPTPNVAVYAQSWRLPES